MKIVSVRDLDFSVTVSSIVKFPSFASITRCLWIYLVPHDGINFSLLEFIVSCTLISFAINFVCLLFSSCNLPAD